MAPPLRGVLEAQQGPDHRRLAGAVGAEEAEDLARFDLEADLVQGPDGTTPVAGTMSAAVVLGQLVGGDGRNEGFHGR